MGAIAKRQVDYILGSNPLEMSYMDELLWGAAWLHKAMKNVEYLNYIQANHHSLGADESDNIFGWFKKKIRARVLLSKEILEDFSTYYLKLNCSMLHLPEVKLQYVTSSSFILLTYTKYLSSSKQLVSCGGVTVTPRKIRAIAKCQISYMVGQGSKYPQRIHHRGSCLSSVAQHPHAIGCIAGFQFLDNNAPNPNLLVRAVVGGPNANDHFPDDRHDYQHCEATTYINAPLVGSLAYMAHSTCS
ncbi:endoglucanase 3-like [Cryptomeria japonica]|uniref:endoglucanase 3-like n=1 Tax=Cryptomeria japonica TaxID=3369 RepID=UPI0025AC835C|nr:endoglucanase 3-like [Cryptomeria japonica]